MTVNQNYKLRKFAGQYYLISARQEEGEEGSGVVQLTETAAWIWTSLEAGLPEDRIAYEMTREFEVDQSTADKAVYGFLDLLSRNGFLESSTAE